MNDTVLEYEREDALWNKLYVGILIGGPIYLVVIFVVILFAVKQQIEIQRFNRRDAERNEHIAVAHLNSTVMESVQNGSDADSGICGEDVLALPLPQMRTDRPQGIVWCDLSNSTGEQKEVLDLQVDHQ